MRNYIERLELVEYISSKYKGDIIRIEQSENEESAAVITMYNLRPSLKIYLQGKEDITVSKGIDFAEIIIF